MSEDLHGHPPPNGRDRDLLVSRLAAFSLGSGLVLCCPAASLASLVSGGIALFLGRQAPPGLPWRRYAWSGVLLGLVGIVLTIGGVLLLDQGKQRWDQETRLLFSGPNNALYELYQGNPGGFLEEFVGPGAEASPSELQSLREALQTRFGTFVSSQHSSQEPIQVTGEGPWTIAGYEVLFQPGDPGGTTTTIPCRIRIDRLASGTLRLVWFELVEDHGSLSFPPNGTSEDSPVG